MCMHVYRDVWGVQNNIKKSSNKYRRISLTPHNTRNAQHEALTSFLSSFFLYIFVN